MTQKKSIDERLSDLRTGMSPSALPHQGKSFEHLSDRSVLAAAVRKHSTSGRGRQGNGRQISAGWRRGQGAGRAIASGTGPERTEVHADSLALNSRSWARHRRISRAIKSVSRWKPSRGVPELSGHAKDAPQALAQRLDREAWRCHRRQGISTNSGRVRGATSKSANLVPARSMLVHPWTNSRDRCS